MGGVMFGPTGQGASTPARRPATRSVSVTQSCGSLLYFPAAIFPHWESLWLDWGIAERYDPQIIGASFRMPVATARTFASPRTEV